MSQSIFKMSVLAASMVLVACGGGDPDPVQNPSYTLAGNAVKGPMKNAKVTVFSITADGKQGDKLGEGTSGDGGAYNIIYQTSYTGPVLVEVEATDATDIQDEANGSVIKAAGLKLRAAVQPPSTAGGSMTVQVNALTETAVTDAIRQEGGLKLANVEKANSDLAATLGFNPQTDAPAFDSNNQPTNKAAVVLAAISQLAKDGDLTDCATATTVGARLKCVVEEVAKVNTGLVGVPALQTKVDTVADKAKIDPPVISTKPPKDSEAPETTAAAQAKSLMNTLRSNAKALDESDLSLKSQASALTDELNSSVRPVVDSTFEMLRTMDFGVQLLEDAQKGSGVYELSRTGLQYAAGCTVYQDSSFNLIATTKENAKTLTCSSYSSITRIAINNTWRWRHRLQIVPKADVAGTYVVKTTARREHGMCKNAAPANCGTFTQTFLGTPDQGRPALQDGTPDTTYSVLRGQEGLADFTRIFTSDRLTALRLTGSTAPSLYYQGLSVNPVLDSGRGRRHEVELDVMQTETNGVQKLSLNSDAFIKFFSSNQAGETVFMSSIGIGKDSFIQAPMVSSAKDGTEKFDLSIGYVAGNSAIRGQLAASDGKWDSSHTTYGPTKVTFGGRLERRVNASSPWVDFLRGTAAMEKLGFDQFNSNLPLSDANPQKTKATINLVMTVPTRPALAIKDFVVNSVKSTPNGDSSNEMQGQYRQGSSVINFSGTQAPNAKPFVTLESTTGIKLVVDPAQTVHPMTKSGVKVGEYDTATKKLNYVDGTFEQF